MASRKIPHPEEAAERPSRRTHLPSSITSNPATPQGWRLSAPLADAVALGFPDPAASEPTERPYRGGANEGRWSSRQRHAASANSVPGSSLPIAISTLRRNRSRPVRFIGDPRTSFGMPHRRARQARPGAARPAPRAAGVGLVRRAGEFVPRADREAIVATIDPVADQRPQLDRDHPLVLDRQIRDAAPRIEPVGRGEASVGQAQAAPARAAVVSFRGIGLELETEINLAEEKPGAELPRYEIGVLTLPAEPGPLGERLFHDRRRIDKQLERTRPPLRSNARRLQPAFQGVVIIAAASIDRNDAAIGVSASASGSSSVDN